MESKSSCNGAALVGHEHTSDRQKVKTSGRQNIDRSRGAGTACSRKRQESFVRKVKTTVACDRLKCVRKLSIIIYFPNTRCCRLFSNERFPSGGKHRFGGAQTVGRGLILIILRPQSILQLSLCQHRTWLGLETNLPLMKTLNITPSVDCSCKHNKILIKLLVSFFSQPGLERELL